MKKVLVKSIYILSSAALLAFTGTPQPTALSTTKAFKSTLAPRLGSFQTQSALNIEFAAHLQAQASQMAPGQAMEIIMVGEDFKSQLFATQIAADYALLSSKIAGISIQTYSLNPSYSKYIDHNISQALLENAPNKKLAATVIESCKPTTLPYTKNLQNTSFILTDSEQTTQRFKQQYPQLASRVIPFSQAVSPGLHNLFEGKTLKTPQTKQQASELLAVAMRFFKQTGNIAKQARQHTNTLKAAAKTLKIVFNSKYAQSLIQPIPTITSANRKNIEYFLRIMARLLAENSNKTIVLVTKDPADRKSLNTILENLKTPPRIASRFIVISDLPADWKKSATALEGIVNTAGSKKAPPQQIVFVSRTNTGLSPMASGYFKSILRQYGIGQNFDVSSGGLEVKPGDKISVNAAQIARIMGFDILDHRARALDINEIEPDATVFAFDLEQRKHLKDEGLDMRQLKVIPVADPAYKPIETYMSCFTKIQRSLEKKFDIDHAISHAQIVTLEPFNLLEQQTWQEVLPLLDKNSYLKSKLPARAHQHSQSESIARSRAIFTNLIWTQTLDQDSSQIGNLFVKLFPANTENLQQLNEPFLALALQAQDSLKNYLSQIGFAKNHNTWQKSFPATPQTLDLWLSPIKTRLELENRFSVELTGKSLRVIDHQNTQQHFVEYHKKPNWDISRTRQGNIGIRIFSGKPQETIRLDLPDGSLLTIHHELRTKHNSSLFCFSNYGTTLFNLLVQLQHSFSGLEAIENLQSTLDSYSKQSYTYENLIARLTYISKFFSTRQFANLLQPDNQDLQALLDASNADVNKLINVIKQLKKLRFSIARQSTPSSPLERLQHAAVVLEKYENSPRLVKIMALEFENLAGSNKLETLGQKLKTSRNTNIVEYLNSQYFTMLLKYTHPYVFELDGYLEDILSRKTVNPVVPQGYGKRLTSFIKYFESNPLNVEKPQNWVTLVEFILAGGANMLPAEYDENKEEKLYKLEEILYSIADSSSAQNQETSNLVQLASQAGKHIQGLLTLHRTCGFNSTYELVSARNWSDFTNMLSVNPCYMAEDPELDKHGSYSARFLLGVPEFLTDIFRAHGYKVDNFPTLEILSKNPDLSNVQGQELEQLQQRFHYFKNFNAHNYKALEILATSHMNIEQLRAFTAQTRQLVEDYIIFTSKHPVWKTTDTSLENFADENKTPDMEAFFLARKFIELEEDLQKQLHKSELDLYGSEEHLPVPASIVKSIRSFHIQTLKQSQQQRQILSDLQLKNIYSMHELINILHQDIISKSMFVFSRIMKNTPVTSPLISKTLDTSYQQPINSTINVVDLRQSARDIPYTASSLPFFEALRQNAMVSPNDMGKSQNITLICDEFDAWGYIRLGVHSIEIYVNNTSPDKGGCVRVQYSEGNQSTGHRRRAKLFANVFEKLGMSVQILDDQINVEAILDKDTGARDIHQIEQTATFITRMIVESMDLDLDLGTIPYLSIDDNSDQSPENTPKEKELINIWGNYILANNYIFLPLVAPPGEIFQIQHRDKPYTDPFMQRMEASAPGLLKAIDQRLKSLGLPPVRSNEQFGQTLLNRIRKDMQKALDNKTIYRDEYGKYQKVTKPLIIGSTGNRDFEMLLDTLKTTPNWSALRTTTHWFNQITTPAVKNDCGSLGGYNVKKVSFPLISSNNIVFLILENRQTGLTDMAAAFEGYMCLPDRLLSAARVKSLLTQSGYIPTSTPEYYDTGLPPAHQTAFMREPRTTTGVSPFYTDGLETSEGTCSGQLAFVTPELTPQQAKGKILVAKYLMPEHDDLIKTCAGVITTHGGQLSHASIRAREFGKPCLILKSASIIDNNTAITFPIELGTPISGTTIVGSVPVHFYTKRNIENKTLETRATDLVMLDANKGKLYYIGNNEDSLTLLDLLKAPNPDIAEICDLLHSSPDTTMANFAITYILENKSITPLQIQQFIDSIMLTAPTENVKNFISNYYASKYNEALEKGRKLAEKIQTGNVMSNILIPLNELQQTLKHIAILEYLIKKHSIATDDNASIDWLLEDTFCRMQAKVIKLRQDARAEEILDMYTPHHLDMLTYKELGKLNSDIQVLENLLYREELAPLKSRAEQLAVDYEKHILSRYTDSSVIWKNDLNGYFRPVVGGKAANAAQVAEIENVKTLDGFAVTQKTFDQIGPNGDWDKHKAQKLKILQAYWTLVKRQRQELLQQVNALQDKTIKNKCLDALYSPVYESTATLPYDNLGPWIDSCVKYTRKHLQDLVGANYRKIPSKIVSGFNSFGSVAVRSSGLKEDSKEESFAGQNLTELNVKTAEQLLQSIKNVWASGAEAILVEPMLNAVVSGVAFSADAITGDSSKIHVNAAYGLGEGIVSGVVDTDKLVLDKATEELAADPIIGAKLKKFVFDYSGGTKLEDISKEESSKLCLSPSAQKQLCQTVKNIEAHFGYPVDVEWAVDASDNIIILQVRPITTIREKAKQALKLFATYSSSLSQTTAYRLKMAQLHQWVEKLSKETDEQHAKYLRTGIARKAQEIQHTGSQQFRVPVGHVFKTSFPQQITLEKQLSLAQTSAGLSIIESDTEYLTVIPLLTPHKKSTYTQNTIDTSLPVTLIMPTQTMLLRARALTNQEHENLIIKQALESAA